MIVRLLLAVLLAWTAAPARAAAPFDGPRAVPPSWVLHGAALDIDCARGRSWPGYALTGAGAPQAIKVTRASTAFEDDLNGWLYAFAVNQLRMTSKGCLIEEARTNSLPQSQFASGYTATETTATATAGIAPDTTLTATLLVPSTNATGHSFVNTTGLTLTAAVYSWSIYVKSAGYGFASLIAQSGVGGGIRYSAVVNLTTGAVTQNGTTGSPANNTSIAACYPNGWCRIMVSMTASTSSTQSKLYIAASATGAPAVDATLNPNAAGDGTSGILAWGAQIELGAFTTSYIPTAAGTAARSADFASMSLPAGATSSSAYSLWALGTPEAPTSYATNQIMAQVDDGTSNSQVFLQRDASTGAVRGATLITGVQTNAAPSGTFAQNAAGKLAAYVSVNMLKAAFNVGTPASGAPTGLAGVGNLRLGTNRNGSGSFWNGYLSRITVSPFSLLNN